MAARAVAPLVKTPLAAAAAVTWVDQACVSSVTAAAVTAAQPAGEHCAGTTGTAGYNLGLCSGQVRGCVQVCVWISTVTRLSYIVSLAIVTRR